MTAFCKTHLKLTSLSTKVSYEEYLTAKNDIYLDSNVAQLTLGL